MASYPAVVYFALQNFELSARRQRVKKIDWESFFTSDSKAHSFTLPKS